MPPTFENPGSTTEAVLSLTILGPILCVLLLRILGPITLCCRGTYNSMHATFSLRILDKSGKSSNMLQVGQIKHYIISFLGAYSTCCIYFFLLSMRLSLEKEEKKKSLKKIGIRQVFPKWVKVYSSALKRNI